MTSSTKRRRRLALMAAGTAAAMVLLPNTAFAQSDPFDELVNSTSEVAQSVTGSEAPAQASHDADDAESDDAESDDRETNPELGAPVEDDDSDGHETDDPQFPDHGSGEVANVELGDQEEDPTEVLDVTEYDATIEDDGSANSGVTVLGLGGDEIVGSEADSAGNTEENENSTEGICEGTGGLLCLSLLYSDAIAGQDADGSFAAARGGVLALCLGGEDEDTVASYECDGLLSLGVAEGIATAQRNNDGNTQADSVNETANLCLGGSDDAEVCDGLGVQVLHSESDSFATDGDQGTERGSYLIGFDSEGDREVFVEDPESLELLDCGEGGGEDGDSLALLCLFFNQGESFIFTDDEGRNGAASAQEALHLDLLRDTPIAILVELGKAESLARDFEDDRDGEKPDDGKKPECSDGVDNDGDGEIDFPNDPECDSPEDDSESGGKGAGNGGGADKGDGGLAFTGANTTPLLAGAFLLIGMGALTMAATRRRIGKHAAA